MHRASGLVGGFFEPDGVDQRIELALREAGVCGQLDLVNFIHQTAEHTALPAASGDDVFGRFLFNVGDAVPGFNSRHTHIPIDSDRFDVMHRRDQPLIAQIPQHQPFGVRTQRHQRDQFAFVDVQGQGAFGRDGHRELFAKFVAGGDLAGQRGLGACEARQGKRIQRGC